MKEVKRGNQITIFQKERFLGVITIIAPNHYCYKKPEFLRNRHTDTLEKARKGIFKNTEFEKYFK